MNGFFRCGSNCNICKYTAHKITQFGNYNQSKMFNIQHRFTCQTEKIVYIAQCSSCNLQYVGHTIKNLRVRLGQHVYDVNNSQSSRVPSALSQHFISVHNRNLQSLNAFAIEQANDKRSLLKRESFWILKLESFAPTGLNYRSDLLTQY